MIEARKRAREMDPNDERKKMEQQRLQQSAAHHGTCACHYDCTMAEISADSPTQVREACRKKLRGGFTLIQLKRLEHNSLYDMD